MNHTSQIQLEVSDLQTEIAAEYAATSRADVIAAIGVNHDGKVGQAIKLIDAARDAGADVVKFQTFRAECLLSTSTPKASHQREGHANQSPLDLLRALELRREDFRRLSAHCDHIGIEFLSTPVDVESAIFLCGLGVRRFKIGSGDVTNIPLMKKIASFRLPVILSTGMATSIEIEEALDVLDRWGAPIVTLLHCVSRYPTPIDDLQLLTIPSLRREFRRAVGFSDHSLGTEASLIARGLGACVIEKHLTLDCSLPGPDHAGSSDPSSFRELVDRLRRVESMLGSGQREFHSEEKDLRAVVRKSVVARAAIQAGEVLNENNLQILRPGVGIPPCEWESVLGRRAACDIPAGEVLTWDKLL